MNRRGFTLIEVLIVIVLIGAMSAIAFPRIGDAVVKQSVASARAGVVGFVAQARGTAIQRGATTRLILASNQLWVEAANPVTGVVERVGNREDFGARYTVTVTPTNDTILYDARGIGMGSAQKSIVVTRGSYAQKVVISVVGRVIQ